MELRNINVQRWSITSQKSFESVVASVEAHIGKPNMTDFGAAAVRGGSDAAGDVAAATPFPPS
jgi:hypothetical protein